MRCLATLYLHQADSSGIGFEHPDDPVPKTKSRNKASSYVDSHVLLTYQRLSEKFWRAFVTGLHEEMSKTTQSEEILPFIGTFEEALLNARMPKPAVVNGTLSGIELRIGSIDIDPSQAIVIPIKYSKATMKARPQTLSKAWKPAMDLQSHPGEGFPRSSASNQLLNSVTEQSQALDKPPAQSDLAAMISAEVKNYSTYVIKRQEAAKEPGSTQAGPDGTQADTQKEQDVEEEDDELVAKEDIVKAWRFGSTWVPMEKDTFDPLDTRKGVEILGFFPRDAVSILTVRA